MAANDEASLFQTRNNTVRAKVYHLFPVSCIIVTEQKNFKEELIMDMELGMELLVGCEPLTVRMQ